MTIIGLLSTALDHIHRHRQVLSTINRCW